MNSSEKTSHYTRRYTVYEISTLPVAAKFWQHSQLLSPSERVWQMVPAYTILKIQLSGTFERPMVKKNRFIFKKIFFSPKQTSCMSEQNQCIFFKNKKLLCYRTSQINIPNMAI